MDGAMVVSLTESPYLVLYLYVVQDFLYVAEPYEWRCLVLGFSWYQSDSDGTDFVTFSISTLRSGLH